MTRALTNDEDTILNILCEHGPTIFVVGSDLTACQWLKENNYIRSFGNGREVYITPKGIRYLNLYE